MGTGDGLVLDARPTSAGCLLAGNYILHPRRGPTRLGGVRRWLHQRRANSDALRKPGGERVRLATNEPRRSGDAGECSRTHRGVYVRRERLRGTPDVYFPEGLPEGFVRGVHLGSPEEERAPEEEGGRGAQGDGYGKPGAHSLEDLSHAFEGTKARRATLMGVYGRLPAFVLTARNIGFWGQTSPRTLGSVGLLVMSENWGSNPSRERAQTAVKW